MCRVLPINTKEEWFYQSNDVLQLGWLIMGMIDWEIWICNETCNSITDAKKSVLEFPLLCCNVNAVHFKTDQRGRNY